MHTTGIRWPSLILGLLCLIVGAIWALQGLGLIPGSVMSGRRMWTVIGILLDLFGLVLVYRGLYRRTIQTSRP